MKRRSEIKHEYLFQDYKLLPFSTTIKIKSNGELIMITSSLTHVRDLLHAQLCYQAFITPIFFLWKNLIEILPNALVSLLRETYGSYSSRISTPLCITSL